jgi:hypothetical protein
MVTRTTRSEGDISGEPENVSASVGVSIEISSDMGMGFRK